jgi:hypothetical protein
MGSMARQQICTCVQQAGYFSILADETKDISKQEQLSIAIRYVDANTLSIVERFLMFVVASNLTAEHLSKYILDTLAVYNLDKNMIVTQGYGGASLMSGCHSGVQQRIKEVVPQAIYVHCHAHCLNLVLVDCVKNISYAFQFFALVQSLYVFMSSSKAHVVFLEMQSQLHPDKQTRQLQRLSDTRWACRYLSLDVIISTFGCILAALDSISESNDKPKAIKATGLLHQIQCFKFISCLVIFHRIMGITKLLSDQLQKTDLDLALAADLVVSTADTLKSLRSDDSWDHTYKYITDVANLFHIEAEEQPVRRRHIRPPRLDDFVSATPIVCHRDDLNDSQSLKTIIYFPVLDHILAELDRRFTKTNLDIMKSLQACHPSSSSFLQVSLLNHLATLYNLDADRLTT